MTCDELRDDYDIYALGALENPELDELRAHLARNCENCTPGVRRAEALIASLAAVLPLVDPPKRLRKKVIGMVDDKAGGYSLWTRILAFTTALFAFFTLHIWLRQQESHRQFDVQKAELARANETLAMLEDPAAKEVTFGKGARGRVILSPSHGVAFLGQNLAALPSGKTYEMWIIPKGGKPLPAGTFAPQPDGSALHTQSGPVDVASTSAVAVSVENEGGVASPTAGQIKIVVPVGQ